MRTLTINLIAVIAIGAAALQASTASAGGFSFGGGKGGGVKFSMGGGNHNHHGHHNHHAHHHHKSHHHNFYHHVPVKRYYVQPVLVYDRCYHPEFRYCYVYPGDTWLTIGQRSYGCTYLWKHIASYNGLPLSGRLVAGQRLQLPVINANGSLAASNAPAPAPFVPQGVQVAAPAQPATSPAPSEEATIPTVAVGSAMQFAGESLGNDKGIVRLRIGEMALPVEITEWSATLVKIQLPKMDLGGAMKAELEVLRADGSLASKSAINLTPAAVGLALGN